MAETFVVMDTPIRATDGHAFAAHVCGRETEGGHWEGWVEFHPEDGGVPLRTPRETTQPSRKTLEYWATGLTVTYLEGALKRALRPPPGGGSSSLPARPAFDGPAPHPAEVKGRPVASPTRALLDPFEAYTHQGEDVLLQELSAMDEGHLRKIARAHQLGSERQVMGAPDRRTLAALIVAEVRTRLRPGT